MGEYKLYGDTTVELDGCGTTSYGFLEQPEEKFLFTGTVIPKDGLMEIVNCDENGKAVFKTDIPVGESCMSRKSPLTINISSRMRNTR